MITTTYGSFSVLDLQTSRAFYGDVLGLQSHERDGMLVVRLPAGGEAVLYPKGPSYRVREAVRDACSRSRG